MKNKYGVLFLSYILLTGFILMLSIIAAIPETPFSLSAGSKSTIQRIIPQGWGFFSKDPRDPLLNASALDSNAELDWPNNLPSNLFGLNRFGRAQGVELGSIVAKVNNTSYERCEERNTECYEKIQEFIEIENYHKKPSLCGKWIISNTDPVPWAWGKHSEKINMPTKVVGVDIKCSLE